MASQASAASTSPDPGQRYDQGGSAGLGKMPSMDPKCTPLKHRYDQCFNLWFDEYLDLAAPAATAPPAASGASSPSHTGFSKGPSSKLDSSSSSFSSFFVSGSSNSPSSSNASQSSGWFSSDATSPAAHGFASFSSRRAELRKKYDSCAALFEDYKTCVRAAVRERDLEPLIAEARCFNPFPFPSGDNKASGGAQSSSNNHPFPFPASENESGNV